MSKAAKKKQNYIKTNVGGTVERDSPEAGEWFWGRVLAIQKENKGL